MKRILVLSVAFLLAAGMLFAAVDSLGGSQGADFSLDLLTGTDLTSSYKAGFAHSAVDAVTDEVTDITSAPMTIDGNGDAILKTDTYVYWQIQSNTALNITLTWDDEMEGTDPDNTLAWSVSSAPVRAQNADDGVASKDAIENKILDRTSAAIANKTFKYGTAGSQKLTITVDDAVNAVTDDYTGTLTLTINSIGG